MCLMVYLVWNKYKSSKTKDSRCSMFEAQDKVQKSARNCIKIKQSLIEYLGEGCTKCHFHIETRWSLQDKMYTNSRHSIKD